ncbi:MAG: hypothetical protein FD134_2235 [Gallionellaceae bacterium]|nr:MAG: hypothetical protein FD134_2235 [Gallionellaceae bacterium]
MEPVTQLQHTGLVVLGKEYAEITLYAGIVPLLDKLVRLSPRDIHIAEDMAHLMYTENDGK